MKDIQMGSMLALKSLQTKYLSPVSLKIASGDIVALHGPSGSGKTLLLRAIADLDPNQGEVLLQGQSRAAILAHNWRKKVAYLPSESHWWSSKVGDHAEHWSTTQLAELGFSEATLDWDITRLSSGEKQRLALARAITNQPSVLLLDEPTANLDADNIELVEKSILKYLAEGERCVLWVSHSPEQRDRLGNRQLRIQQGQLNNQDAPWN